jgi:hypothetical protein
MKKLISVLKGDNFKITLFSMLSLFVNYNGVPLESGEDLFKMFDSKSLVELAIPIIMMVYNVGSKLFIKFKEKTLDYSIFQSENFMVQVTTVLSLFIGVYFNEVLTGILIALVLNIYNTIIHLRKPAKSESQVIEIKSESDIKL